MTTTRTQRAIARINAVFDEPGSMRAIAIMRLAFGAIVILHLQPFIRDMRADTYYGEWFYLPWVDWYPEVSKPVYFALLWAAVGSAVCMSLGLFTRIATALTAGIVSYNFFLSQTFFRHNRAFLIACLVVLALVPCGRALSIDAWWRRRRRGDTDDRGPVWPIYLLRAELSLIYIGSGFSKLIDPDWWGGIVLWDRVIRFKHTMAGRVPEWIQDIVLSRDFHWVFAKLAVCTELFIAAAIWWRPTRLAAIWVLINFHLSIEVSARVQVFSWAVFAASLILVTPSTRDRVLEVNRRTRGGRLIGWCARWLDWLARFDVRDAAAGAPPVTLTDRDGAVYRGAAGARIALSRMPALFYVMAPLLLPGIRRAWDRLLRGAFGSQHAPADERVDAGERGEERDADDAEPSHGR